MDVYSQHSLLPTFSKSNIRCLFLVIAFFSLFIYDSEGLVRRLGSNCSSYSDCSQCKLYSSCTWMNGNCIAATGTQIMSLDYNQAEVYSGKYCLNAVKDGEIARSDMKGNLTMEHANPLDYVNHPLCEWKIDCEGTINIYSKRDTDSSEDIVFKILYKNGDLKYYTSNDLLQCDGSSYKIQEMNIKSIVVQQYWKIYFK